MLHKALLLFQAVLRASLTHANQPAHFPPAVRVVEQRSGIPISPISAAVASAHVQISGISAVAGGELLRELLDLS